MQWQYKTVLLPLSGMLKNKVDPAELDAVLNQHGQERWELVNMFLFQAEMAKDGVVAVFKRPSEFGVEVSELRGVCLSCGYDLRGADHDACPECGWKAVTTDSPS